MNEIPDNINDIIQNLYISAPDNIHGIGLGFKTINGIKTNEIAIVYSVLEKKPVEQLNPEDIIPKTIQISESSIIRSDVIQANLPSISSNCYSYNDSSSDAHRAKYRPLKCGVSFADSNGTAGTLGLIVRDNEDNHLVALTNNHVIVTDALINSVKTTPISIPYDIRNKPVLQPGPYDGGTVAWDTLGFVKRYYPLQGSFNFIDAALASLSNVADATTAIEQLGLNNLVHLPAASTSEINGLLNIPPPILSKSGRTTGFIGGATCPIVITALSLTQAVTGYNSQGVSYTVTFSDCMAFEYENGGLYPSMPGDSGSVLVADINGTNKIVGLVFAGDGSSFGIACRIDRVLDMLNVSVWDGSFFNPPYPTSSTIEYISKPGLLSTPIIIENGKKYWQVGIDSNNTNNSLYAHFSSTSSSTDTSGSDASDTNVSDTEDELNICDIGIKCSTVINRTDTSISLYIVYNDNYSSTDTYLELAFYDKNDNMLQSYTSFTKLHQEYDVFVIDSSNPLVMFDIKDVCNISARLFQPNPCIITNPFDFSASGASDTNPCSQSTLGDMTGYLVEAIYVSSSTFDDCYPDQGGVSQATVVEKDIFVSAAGDTTGCGVDVKSPCGGGHLCNRAKFDIQLSVGSNSPVTVLEANLNNAGGAEDNGPSTVFGGTWYPLYDGIGLSLYDRYSSSIITAEKNNEIMGSLPPMSEPGDPNYDLTLSITPAQGNDSPHSGITWVRIKDTCGRIIYSCCIGGKVVVDPCRCPGESGVFPECDDPLELEKCGGSAAAASLNKDGAYIYDEDSQTWRKSNV